MARFRAISSDSRGCAAVALSATVEDKRLPPATKPLGNGPSRTAPASNEASRIPSYPETEPLENRAVAVPSAIPSVITPGDQRKCELSNWIRIQLIISSHLSDRSRRDRSLSENNSPAVSSEIPLRNRAICASPKSNTASYWLCARQRKAILSTVCSLQRAQGTR